MPAESRPVLAGHFRRLTTSVHAVCTATPGATNAKRRRNPAEYPNRAWERLFAAASMSPAQSAPMANTPHTSSPEKPERSITSASTDRPSNVHRPASRDAQKIRADASSPQTYGRRGQLPKPPAFLRFPHLLMTRLLPAIRPDSGSLSPTHADSRRHAVRSPVPAQHRRHRAPRPRAGNRRFRRVHARRLHHPAQSRRARQATGTRDRGGDSRRQRDRRSSPHQPIVPLPRHGPTPRPRSG